MLDHETLCQPTADVVAAIESLRPAKAKPANYDSPEGVLFRKAMGLIEDERDWYQSPRMDKGWVTQGERTCRCSFAAIHDAYAGSGIEPIGACIYQALYDVMDGINGYNATHTHAEVMAKWRECGIANGWL